MYHLFAGDGYYPMQGLGDYKDSYEDLNDAVERARVLCEPQEGRKYGECEWYSILKANDEGKLIEVDSGWSHKFTI